MKLTLHILSILCIILCCNCTDSQGARKILAQKGYTNITFTGYRPFKCWKDEAATGFTATDSNGFEVSGCVCSSIFTGQRINLDK